MKEDEKCFVYFVFLFAILSYIQLRENATYEHASNQIFSRLENCEEINRLSTDNFSFLSLSY